MGLRRSHWSRPTNSPPTLRRWTNDWMAMKHEIKVPTVGESIQEVQIGKWLKGEGQWANRDENLVEIESDKATVDLAAPAAGILVQVLHRQGDVVPVGTLIGYLEEAPRPDGSKTATPAAPRTRRHRANVRRRRLQRHRLLPRPIRHRHHRLPPPRPPRRRLCPHRRAMARTPNSCRPAASRRRR